MRRHDATLASRHDLHGMQAERGCLGKAPHLPLAVCSAERVTTVGEDAEAVALSELLERRVVAGLTCVVHPDYSARTAGHPILSRGHVQQECVGLNINEHRSTTLEHEG